LVSGIIIIVKGARGRLQEPSNEKNQKSLQKPLDKPIQKWYNSLVRLRERWQTSITKMKGFDNSED
jgi:hypothetical protein